MSDAEISRRTLGRQAESRRAGPERRMLSPVSMLAKAPPSNDKAIPQRPGNCLPSTRSGNVAPSSQHSE